MHHCQHKWWTTLVKYHHRWCKYCFHAEYNYTGEWEEEIKLPRFIGMWTSLGGHEPENAMTLECCQMFERWGHETWNSGFVVVIGKNRHGPYPNLNAADFGLRKFYGKSEIGGVFDSSQRAE